MASEASPNLDRETIHRKVEYAVRLTRDEQYEDALALFEMYLPLLSSGTDADKRLLAESSSHCGLCMAMVKHKYSEGLDYCNISLKRDILNPDHHANIALLYLERDDRKNGVKHLHKGLRLQPRHKRINKILDEIGRRRPPVLPFLSRQNPINVALGKLRGGPKRPRRREI